MPGHSAFVDWESLALRSPFGALTAVAIVFLVGPSLIVLLTSLTASQSLRFPPDGLSLRWYQALLTADQMQRAAWTSLIVAFWTTVASAVLGTAASLAVARSQSALARVFDVVFLSPLLPPGLALRLAAPALTYPPAPLASDPF